LLVEKEVGVELRESLPGVPALLGLLLPDPSLCSKWECWW
jgi:hypothetical protein